MGRDAVVFPEVVAVADALLDPAMAELAWKDSGAGQPRLLPADGAPGSGTTWRSTVPAEQRALITSLVNDAEEQLTQLRGAQYGKTADAAQQLLGNLGHAATLIDQALRETAAALTAGVALEDLAQWSSLPAEILAEALAVHHSAGPGNER
ncbi:hypothetical protein [Streptomyces sp. NPDC095613]|uniref:hypothetical protein n=1 Tax=Streptomyces sp. NPDC095613 TaxID=3155540 RepID=UPI0033242C00